MPTNDAHAMRPPILDQTEHPVLTSSPNDVTRDSYDQCNRVFQWDSLDMPVLTLCLVLFVAGLVYCFAGSRLHKAVMFITGVLFGGSTVYVICVSESVLPHALGNASIALGAGVLFGLITMLVDYVGLFLTGFLCGIHFGVVALAAAKIVLADPIQSIWIHISLLFLSGLCMALVTLRWQRAMVMLCTAVMGGALVTICIDYVLLALTNSHWLYDLLSLRPVTLAQLCWHNWMLFGMWPALTLMGLIVQTQITAQPKPEKRNHTPHLSSSACATPDNLDLSTHPVRREHHRRTAHAFVDRQAAVLNRNMSPNLAQNMIDLRSPIPSPKRKMSFRSLYQARRKHGDIICQSFMDSMDRQRAVYSLNSSGTDQGTLSSEHTRVTLCSHSSNTPPVQSAIS